mgnify:FL=1
MKAQGIGICEWALPTPLRGPLVCRVLKDLGLAAVELKLGTVEKNFPLANRYTLDLYKEEQAKYGTVFTGIAVNLTDFYAMTAPLGSSDREMVEYALRTAVDAAQYLGAPLIHVPSLHALKSEVRTDEGLKNSAKMQLRQLELVDRENYGIYFDTQNPHALNGLDAPSLIEPIFNHIPEFHIKDGFDQISPHLIDEGSCDPFRSLAEFDRLGYTGWIILENYFWRVPLCQRGDDPYALLRRDLDAVRTWLAAHA